MNRRNNSTHGIKPPRPKGKRPGDSSRPAPGRYDRNHPKPTRQLKASSEPGFQIIERLPPTAQGTGSKETISYRSMQTGPFRVLIAVHRPRYRGRTERAAAIIGWEITALLNKQDPVGLCARPPRPPDVLILSGDFGRQKDLAIFRAVQRYRRQGMRLIGLVDDCHTAPEGFPDSVPTELCDICLEPPYKTADLRALLSKLYTELRGEFAPPPIAKADASEEEEEEGS